MILKQYFLCCISERFLLHIYILLESQNMYKHPSLKEYYTKMGVAD